MKKIITLILSIVVLTACGVESPAKENNLEGIGSVTEQLASQEFDSPQSESTAKEVSGKEPDKQSEEAPEQSSKRVPVEFVRIVDGDTARFIYEGEEESVRYLLIDTPESKNPKSCVQPFGEEASDRNEELLKSGEVTLEFEKSERDHYGRLLAYVFVDGVSVQETLIEEGYGKVAYIYEPPYKYIKDYEEAEEKAKENRVNIWSMDGFSTSEGFTECVDDKVVEVEEVASSSASDGETEAFANCTALREVYPSGVPSDHPAYQPKMDRNKDGFACER